MSNERFLRLCEVKAVTGLSRSSIVRLERLGLFPRRRRIGLIAVGWVETEIVAWIGSREGAEVFGTGI